MYLGVAALALTLAAWAWYRWHTRIRRARRARSPLDIAVEEHDTAEALRLLREGADPDTRMSAAVRLMPGGQFRVRVQWPVFGSARSPVDTPVLLSAALGGNKRLVEALLDDGADPDARSRCGQTALMAAAWSGSLSCVRLLLAAGADVTLHDDTGLTALAWARVEGRADIVRALRAAGADE